MVRGGDTVADKTTAELSTHARKSDNVSVADDLYKLECL